MKRWICFLLTMACLLSCVCALAKETTTQEGIYTYYVSQNQAIITNVLDREEVLVIPEKLGGYTVTRIENGACGGHEKLREVVLPDGLLTIGSMCFAYSNNLEKVTFGENLKTIENGAFYHCRNLWTVALPERLQTIEDIAFGRCVALTAVSLPDGIKTIGKDVFPEAENLTIYAKVDSTGHSYATKNEICFEEAIHVEVNGGSVLFDQPPVTNQEHFRTLVPMRTVFETLGGTVSWNNDQNCASVDIDGYTINILSGTDVMTVNGEAVTLSCPTMEFNNRTMVPIRDMVEAIGGTVSWDEEKKLVSVAYSSTDAAK